MLYGKLLIQGYTMTQNTRIIEQNKNNLRLKSEEK